MSGYSSPNGLEPGCVLSTFDFTQMSTTAQIGPVTSSIDSLAPADELTFKCYVPCPATQDCSSLTGQVYWYSNGVNVYNGSLSYAATTKTLYSFFRESLWTNYINSDVYLHIFFIKIFFFCFNLIKIHILKISCIIIPYSGLNRPSFTIISSSYYAGIKCSVDNPNPSDLLVL